MVTIVTLKLAMSSHTTNDRSTAPWLSPSKKGIKLIPKAIGNRKKRLHVRLLSVINAIPKKYLQIAKHKISNVYVFPPLNGLICSLRSADTFQVVFIT